MNRNHTFIREPIVSGDQEYYSKPNRPCLDDYCRNTKQQTVVVHEKTKSIRNQNCKKKDFRELQHQSEDIITFHEKSPKTEKVHQFEAGFQSTQKSFILDKNQEKIHNIPILIQEVSNHHSSEEIKSIQDKWIEEIHKASFYETSDLFSSSSSPKDTSTSYPNNHSKIELLKKNEKDHVFITQQTVSPTLEKSDMNSISETKKVKSQKQIVDPLESHPAHTSIKFITDTMISSGAAASAPVVLKTSKQSLMDDVDDESVAETDSSISSIMKEDTKSNSEILENDDDDDNNDSTILPMSPISLSLLMWILTAMKLFKFLVWKLPIRILVVTMKMTLCMIALYYCAITFMIDDGNAWTCTSSSSSSMSYAHMFNTARVY